MYDYEVIIYDVVCWYFLKKTKCVMELRMAANDHGLAKSA